jgi:hypothetical protein
MTALVVHKAMGSHPLEEEEEAQQVLEIKVA